MSTEVATAIMDSGRPVSRTMRLKLLGLIGGFDEASGACDGLAHWVRLVNVEMMVNQSVWWNGGCDRELTREERESPWRRVCLIEERENKV